MDTTGEALQAPAPALALFHAGNAGLVGLLELREGKVVLIGLKTRLRALEMRLVYLFVRFIDYF